MLEKAREIGQHSLSGALLDPRSMDELLPGWKDEAPIEVEVTSEAVYFLTRKSKFKAPITPPPLRDHGNYVISLNRFVKWLGSKVEETGITIFSGFAGSELLIEEGKVAGVRTDDKGVDKQNQPKANFEPGYDLKSKILILAEGPRGSLTKQLAERFELDRDRNPMTYGVGVKELWELPAGRIGRGEVIYTMGWPLTSREYGGAWIYGGKDNVVSLGFVTGLDYPDPRTDPQHVLQSFKQHPFVRSLLEGGKMVRYGAKTLPYGGWWAMPPLAGDGWMIVGDSAGFLNSQRLKGIHLAIKSGMLAAETAFEALDRRQLLRRSTAGVSRKRWTPAGSSRSSTRCATSTRASSAACYRDAANAGAAADHRRQGPDASATRPTPDTSACCRSGRRAWACGRTASSSSAGPRATASSPSTS